jgi:hypothetical protein
MSINLRPRVAAICAVASLMLPWCGGVAAAAAPNGPTPAQLAAIADDPPFKATALVMEALPQSAQAPRVLFNGRDLDGWDSWLGYKDPRQTYTGPDEPPIGLNRDTAGVFTVVTEDGRPAIRSSGEIWGALTTRDDFANYHLRLQFKWGPRTWLPMPRNNGVLYHSHGRQGAFFGTWMSAVEFEVVPGSVGMVIGVGDSRGGKTFAEVDWKVGLAVEVGHDPAIRYPSRRYMPGGRLVPIAWPAFNAEANRDAERPIGEWNTLDLYVFGDRAVHVVNGVPVMVAGNFTTTDGASGKARPLTSGRIQLQSEGAETFFRDITIEPIEALPVVRAK